MSSEELGFLLTLKNSGIYRHRNGRPAICERLLFETLFEYLYLKHRLNNVFKVKWFRDKDRNSRFNCFYDVPLTVGEARSAVRYGLDNGLVKKVNSSRTFHVWSFTDKALNKYNGGLKK